VTAMAMGPPPRTMDVIPCTGGTPAPGFGIPSVIGPVQRIRKRRWAAISRSEHDRYDEFRGAEVSAFAEDCGEPAGALYPKGANHRILL